MTFVTKGGGAVSAALEHLQTAGRGSSIFGSAAERAMTVTVHRHSSARCDAAGRDRSISGWMMT